jgi:hypothetical protein
MFEGIAQMYEHSQVKDTAFKRTLIFKQKNRTKWYK